MQGIGRVVGKWVLAVAVGLLACGSALASEYHGTVTYAGLPVPGATVTVTQGGKKFVTVTDTQGFYTFPTLADGPASVSVEMTGFEGVSQEVTVAVDGAMTKLELKLMSLERMRSELKPALAAPYTAPIAVSEVKKTGDTPKAAVGAAVAAAAVQPEELTQRATDGLLVNGSVNNAATSQFTLGPRFGNTASGKSLYSYSLNVRDENSALDAKSYSLSGQDTTKPQTNQLTGGFAIQGPLKIPHVLRNGPNIFVGYQRTQNSTAITTSGLVPDAAVRVGDLSHELDANGKPVVAINPATGMPYQGEIVPVSAQAAALIALYPAQNVFNNPIFNYQVPLVTDVHQDAVNSNATKTIGRKDQVTATLAAQSTRTSGQTLLGFVDTTRGLGVNSTLSWNHAVNARLHWNVGYQFSRQTNRSTPFWQNRANVSGAAGIKGNDQDPAYWGPPNINFSGGISSLYDANAYFNRSQTSGGSASVRLNRSKHNYTLGADLRRQEFNYLNEANPRGTFTFTTTRAGGTGSDVADFLLGNAATTAVSYGNADKYLRQTAYDAYFTDDWRLTPQLTVNAGVRYEYGGPITETKNRLANLDVAGNFVQVATVTAMTPKGSLTGQSLPGSLMRADRTGFQPRIGVSWRPLPGSSLLLSAGYGITYDTSVYQGIALQLAEQQPFALTQVAQSNSVTCQQTLTLMDGLTQCPSAYTFGVDPNYRIGYLQTWNAKLQRDLPMALQLNVIYLGNKGTRGAQLFLPNTVPLGGVAVCAACPVGFEYLASGGNSTRESGQIQLRRRLKSGFTASLLYTYAKSIDDDSSLGGQGAASASNARIAQDWTNLRGERGLSTFDQRHLLNAQVQYTTGMGKGGGSLLSGWRGRVYKEWTFQAQVNAGTGEPETPVVGAITVAGYASFVRPNVTGAPLYARSAGRFLNPAAFAAPSPGQWGNARRGSVTGPGGISVNAAMVRTFRLNARVNLDAQITAQNAINHVTYSDYDVNINSSLFGVPESANAMRQVQTALRLRF
jgi:hypothetical protein